MSGDGGVRCDGVSAAVAAAAAVVVVAAAAAAAAAVSPVGGSGAADSGGARGAVAARRVEGGECARQCASLPPRPRDSVVVARREDVRVGCEQCHDVGARQAQTPHDLFEAQAEAQDGALAGGGCISVALRAKRGGRRAAVINLAVTIIIVVVIVACAAAAAAVAVSGSVGRGAAATAAAAAAATNCRAKVREVLAQVLQQAEKMVRGRATAAQRAHEGELVVVQRQQR